LGIQAVDDHTLEVKITTPLPYFPQMLVHGSTFPVLQGVVEEHGDDWTDAGTLVGNGAYKLVEHQLGERVVMEKNDTYWDADNVVMEKITALTINDVNQALTRYLAGELDRVDIPAGQYPRLKKEYPEQAVSTPYNCSYIYMLNVGEKGPEALKNVNVRKALAYAIDRDIIVERILQGGQKPSYNWTHWAIAARGKGQRTVGRGGIWPRQPARPDAAVQHIGRSQKDRHRCLADAQADRREPDAG